MTLTEELKALLAKAENQEVKELIAGKIATLEADAKAAAETLHAKFEAAIASGEQWVASHLSEARALLAKVRASL